MDIPKDSAKLWPKPLLDRNMLRQKVYGKQTTKDTSESKEKKTKQNIVNHLKPLRALSVVVFNIIIQQDTFNNKEKG